MLENIHKEEDVQYGIISDSESSSVTLIKMAMKAREYTAILGIQTSAVYFKEMFV